MACCALAAFVVSQLLFALDALRERVLGLAPALAQPNANAAWRLGDAAPPRGPRAATPRRVALACAGGALAFALGASALEAPHRPHAVAIPYLCSSSGTLALD